MHVYSIRLDLAEDNKDSFKDWQKYPDKINKEILSNIVINFHIMKLVKRINNVDSAINILRNVHESAEIITMKISSSSMEKY
jgi:hypothetical protein